MQIYFPSLQAICQQTTQLDLEQCPHCQRRRQLVSHGFIRKKRVGAEPEAVGKRVFCSNRRRHTGCGRTMQLYLDTTVRFLHRGGAIVVAFVLLLIAGMSIERAYTGSTGAGTGRNAYRWLARLDDQLTGYRSLSHRPPLREAGAASAPGRSLRRSTLMATFVELQQRFDQPLCATYQQQLQRPLL
ncbi:MAG: hypothetical protein WKG03_13135 [Telluria sp.]